MLENKRGCFFLKGCTCEKQESLTAVRGTASTPAARTEILLLLLSSKSGHLRRSYVGKKRFRHFYVLEIDRWP